MACRNTSCSRGSRPQASDRRAGLRQGTPGPASGFHAPIRPPTGISAHTSHRCGARPTLGRSRSIGQGPRLVRSRRSQVLPNLCLVVPGAAFSRPTPNKPTISTIQASSNGSPHSESRRDQPKGQCQPASTNACDAVRHLVHSWAGPCAIACSSASDMWVRFMRLQDTRRIARRQPPRNPPVSSTTSGRRLRIGEPITVGKSLFAERTTTLFAASVLGVRTNTILRAPLATPVPPVATNTIEHTPRGVVMNRR